MTILSKSSAAGFDRDFQVHVLPVLTLLVVTVLSFWEVPGHSLLINWDDQIYVTGNAAIRGINLPNLKTAFSGYYVGNYAPVQIISYMLDHAMWGDTAFGYFLANILYHFMSGILLYFLLVRLGSWKWGAVFGVVIFLVHPVQVESVAWISQRKNLLAMLFCLVAFHAYLSYRDREGEPSRRWYYAWSVVAFSLALLSKSVAVIFPLMLVIYDLLIPSPRRSFSLLLDKLPFLAAAAIFGVVALVSQDSSHGGGRIDYPPDALVTLPLSMLPVLVRYLQLLVWPVSSLQSVMYFPPLRSNVDSAVVLGFVVVSALVASGVYLYRKNRPCLFWYVLFFLGLLPVSQVVPLVTMMNDRYLYFPMLGVAGLAAHLAGSIHRRSVTGTWSRAVIVVCIGVTIVLSYASHMRARVWKDSITLFSDAVAKYPDHAAPWSRLAEGYLAKDDLVTARKYYENASRIGSLDAGARRNLARLYLLAGEYEKAYEHIWWLLLRGDKSRVNMALLGEYYYRTGVYLEAERYLLSYLEEFPTAAHELYLLGRVYFSAGELEMARETYSRAILEGSATPELFYGLACLEFKAGQTEKSLSAMRTSLENGLRDQDLHEDEQCYAALQDNPLSRQLLDSYPVKPRP